MRATMLLAEAAQVADGKLNLLGAGWKEIGVPPSPTAVGILLEFCAEEANGSHHFELFLTDPDLQPVFSDSPQGQTAVEVRGDANVTLPPTLDSKLAIPWPIAVNVPTLPLVPGAYYQWNLVVDGHSDPSWVLPFRARPTPIGSAPIEPAPIEQPS